MHRAEARNPPPYLGRRNSFNLDLEVGGSWLHHYGHRDNTSLDGNGLNRLAPH